MNLFSHRWWFFCAYSGSFNFFYLFSLLISCLFRPSIQLTKNAPLFFSRSKFRQGKTFFMFLFCLVVFVDLIYRMKNVCFVIFWLLKILFSVIIQFCDVEAQLIQYVYCICMYFYTRKFREMLWFSFLYYKFS